MPSDVFTLTDADKGRVLDALGWVSSLVMTVSPPYETPEPSRPEQRFAGRRDLTI